MKKGATIAPVIYTVVVMLAAIYWSAMAAIIIGVFGLAMLTAWSCCVAASDADDAWATQNDSDPMAPDWLELARDAEHEHPRYDAEGEAVQ